MKLLYPGNDYSLFTYPAGEIQVRLSPQIIPRIHLAEQVEIDARVTTASALVGLLLLADAIRGVKPGAKLILNIPYLPYARADRRFVQGDCFGLKVFGELLRCGVWNEIHTLDVHNTNAAWTQVSSFLDNRPAMPFIQRAADDFKPDALLFPDEGAAKRYAKTGFPSIYATKHRDPASGRLSDFQVPDVSRYGRILVVDDLCDGGGTFLGITGVIPPGPTFGLYVTHGIFSNGTKPLTDIFEKIYTTNSYWGFPSNDPRCPQLTVYDAFEALHGP